MSIESALLALFQYRSPHERFAHGIQVILTLRIIREIETQKLSELAYSSIDEKNKERGHWAIAKPNE